MTDRAVMQQALDALESIEWHGAGSCWVLDDEKVESAHDALRQALAQPERKHPLQVRVDRDHAWKMRDTACGCDHNEYCEKCWPLEFRKGGYWDQQEALATTPPSATDSAHSADTFCNQPAERKSGCTLCGHCAATGERIAMPRKPLPVHEIVTMYDESPTGDSDMIDFARAIEQAHGIGVKP